MRSSIRNSFMHALTIAIGVLSTTSVQIAFGQSQSGISLMVAKTCDVMSGKRKFDGQTLQYLIMLDDGDAFENPVEMIFQQQVIRTCPKSYVAYAQRKRAHNPYPSGYLIKKGQTPLIN